MHLIFPLFWWWRDDTKLGKSWQNAYPSTNPVNRSNGWTPHFLLPFPPSVVSKRVKANNRFLSLTLNTFFQSLEGKSVKVRIVYGFTWELTWDYKIETEDVEKRCAVAVTKGESSGESTVAQRNQATQKLYKRREKFLNVKSSVENNATFTYTEQGKHCLFFLAGQRVLSKLVLSVSLYMKKKEKVKCILVTQHSTRSISIHALLLCIKTYLRE